MKEQSRPRFKTKECLKIANWVPPYIDNGERLQEIIDVLRSEANQDNWAVMMVMLADQFVSDIEALRYIHKTLNEVVINEDKM